jgi:hypothetical protein
MTIHDNSYPLDSSEPLRPYFRVLTKAFYGEDGIFAKVYSGYNEAEAYRITDFWDERATTVLLRALPPTEPLELALFKLSRLQESLKTSGEHDRMLMFNRKVQKGFHCGPVR